jgi:Membrane domain of glycerophosphoryl diester phosphodiesterase
MSFNASSPEPIQPLSLGNVVSAGLRLYRSHLKSYLQLSSLAYAWALIPVYGWAKCAAILALISRLAFSELVNQPESVQDAKRLVNSRMWQFLVMGLLMLLITIGLTIAVMIPLGIVVGMITAYATLGAANGTPNAAAILLLALLVLVFIPLLFVMLLWMQARLLVVELPLAIEDGVDGSSTIGRSWNLTKGSVWRIVGIILVAYLITLPIQLPFTLLSQFIQIAFTASASDNPSNALFGSLLSLIVSLIGAVLVVPFWQAIKAVIYYDLRNRREGFGLKLRDREV